MHFLNFSLLAVISFLITNAVGAVEPFDCDTYSGPLQVLEVAESIYDVRQLNFSAGSDGSYSLVYTIPSSDCIQINGCGIHPFDDVPYCHCQRSDERNSIIRFDENRVETVMFVDSWSYSGGFIDDGRYFYLSERSMYEISNMNTSNPSVRELYQFTLGDGERQPADIVFQTFDLLGDGNPRAYAISMRDVRTLIIFPLDEDCTNFDDTCQYSIDIVGSSRAAERSGYGAGWVFEGTSYFSDNRGSGVYKIMFENEVGEPLSARMSWVTLSETTNKNDGMVCYGQEDVFVGLPTLFPTPSPTSGPTNSPTTRPSDFPTRAPHAGPSPSPTSEPTDLPSVTPTNEPSELPSLAPSYEPTPLPTSDPTGLPSMTPTYGPTTAEPSELPSLAPSSEPTPSPTSGPTNLPSMTPTYGPTTAEPSELPSLAPSPEPTPLPTAQPSNQPSTSPTISCLSFKMTCSDGYAGHFNVRQEIWRSEWLEMTSDDVMKVEHIPDTGFRWVVETGGSVMIADSEGDRFTEVKSWSGVSCDFECSPVRLTTSAPTPSAPSISPTTVLPSSLPTSATPTKSPESSIPTASPSQAPSSSMPTDVPSENPTISEPTEQPTQAPTLTCLTFEFECESATGFEGIYVRELGWKVEFNQISGGNAHFSTGFVGTSPRWVFSEGVSALISDTFEDGAFDQIYSWSGNKCTIECSGSFPPTISPIASVPSPAPTANEPTLMPTISVPTSAPTTTSIPTKYPSFSSPTELPTSHPASSDPTEFPSSSPTTPCLAFEAYCSNAKFNGIYNFNGYNRKWFLRDGEAIFSISALPDSSLAWIFEFPNDEEILHADYKSDFTSIASWSMHNRLNMVEIESSISCAFSCSVTVTPSTSPSTSLPTYTPTSPAPTSSIRYSLVLENHLAGGTTYMSEPDISRWIEAIAHLLHGPQEINMISMKSMVPDRRRALTNPTLNITAEVFFETQEDLDAQYSLLLTENDHMNSLLEIYLPMKGIDDFETIYIGLAGQFDGQYYVPTNMPTLLPTVDDNTEIVIVIDGPGDIDDITNVTDTVTGDDTTVISITDNGDGTTTVVIGCTQCNPNDDINTDVENGLEDANISVISVNTRDGGAMNTESGAMSVVTSGITWMIIALITAAILGLYLLWTGRRKMKRCLTCTKKQKVIDVPKDLEFEIAQANVLPANVLPRIMSESWTAATAVTRGNSFSSVWALEGDETRFDEDFSDDEGNLTIEINPARIQDGDHPTGYDDDESEDGHLPTGYRAQPQVVDGYTTGAEEYGSDSDTAMDDAFEGDEFTRLESPSSPTAVMLDAPKRTLGITPSYDSIYSDEGTYYETRQDSPTATMLDAPKRTLGVTPSNDSIYGDEGDSEYYHTQLDSPTATMLDAPKRTLGITPSNDSIYGDEGDSEYYRTQPESPTATMLEAPKRSIGFAVSVESITEYEFDQPLGKRMIHPPSPKSFSFGGAEL